MNREHLIFAAGGNATVLQVRDEPMDRRQYVVEGDRLMTDFDEKGAEQAGFLILNQNHFEMQGGEFCGNASRAAGWLLSKLKNKSLVEYTVSGFDGNVKSTVTELAGDKAFVSSTFVGMKVPEERVVLPNQTAASVVDLGGIVHVVIAGKLPSDYRQRHREIVETLGLSHRDAVGVLWYQDKADIVHMDPVVWVRESSTFYYETSCGSGTIAVAKVTGKTRVEQVSGQVIEAEITDGSVILASEMEAR